MTDDNLRDEATTLFFVARHVGNAQRQQQQQPETSADEPSQQRSSSMRVVETVYLLGGVFALLFIVFNLIRNRYPRLYNPRQQVAPCELSSRRWFPFAWMGAVARITDSELEEQASAHM
jgi:hypothetical protein